MRFDELGLDADILRSLEAMNFEEMTPVQEHTIPIILENKDLIGCAQTGTGKTAAYTLPLLDKLLREGNPDNVVKSLIVVPTRELAQQIDVQFQGFSYFLPLSTTVVYGGGDRSRACCGARTSSWRRRDACWPTSPTAESTSRT